MIKDPEADRLVRELVAMTGESITDAARTAFAERFEQSLFQSSGDAAITTANLLEAMLVIESRNPATGAQDLRALVDSRSSR